MSTDESSLKHARRLRMYDEGEALAWRVLMSDLPDDDKLRAEANELLRLGKIGRAVEQWRVRARGRA